MIPWVERKPLRESWRMLPKMAFEAWPLPAEALDPDNALDDMHAWHGGLCAACGCSSKLHLDHDHDTGKVRGYLCSGCNTHEGMTGSGDRPIEVMWQRWRTGTNPATALGVDEQYTTPFAWARTQVRDPIVAAMLGVSPYSPR